MGKLRPSYYVRTGSMYENPYGVPIDQIERMRRELPPEVVAQAIFGKFVESSGLVFTAVLINQLFDRSLPEVNAPFWYDKERTRQIRDEQLTGNGDRYRVAVGVDLARQNDFTVIIALDTRTMPARVIYYKRINKVPWEQIYAEIGRAQWLYDAELLIDRTGSGGDVVNDELESRYYCPVHHHAYPIRGRCPDYGTPVKGWDFGGSDCSTHAYRIDPQGFVFSRTTKIQLINHLQNALGSGYNADDPEQEFGLLRSPPILLLQEQLTEYAWDDKKLDTDDVFALALAAWQGIEGVVDPVLAGSVYGS